MLYKGLEVEDEYDEEFVTILEFIISSPDPGFIEIHPELAYVKSKVPDFVTT